MLKILLLITLISSSVLASDMQMQSRDLSTKEMKSQNKLIAKLAAIEINKSLPQIIDKSTTLKSVKSSGTTIIYTFEINIAPKSDKTVIEEDHSTMKKIITKGTCNNSKRFLESNIALRYVYINSSNKKELFRFDVNQESCL